MREHLKSKDKNRLLKKLLRKQRRKQKGLRKSFVNLKVSKKFRSLSKRNL